MDFDGTQQVWQSQEEPTVTVHSEALLREVRRNERSFQVTVFWRDVREVLVAAVLAVMFLRTGIRARGWPWFVLAGSCLWIAVFMLIDRIRWKRKVVGYGESLVQRIGSSLEQVEHQIRLLASVLWWYILPPGLGILLVLGWEMWHIERKSWPLATAFGLTAGLCVAVFVFVWWLNQRAVRKELEPRRDELRELLASLQEDSH